MANKSACANYSDRSGDKPLAHLFQNALLSSQNTIQDCEVFFCKFRPDGTLTFVNQTYGNYLQRSPEDLIGLNIVDLVPPHARETLALHLQVLQQLTPEQPAITQDYEAIAADGARGWQRWMTLALFDQHGTLLELQAIGQDITNSQHHDHALQESEQLLSSFFSQSLNGFFFMMLDEPIFWNDGADKEALLDYVFHHQRITRVNQAFLNQYLATETEILGATPAELFAHDLAAGRQAWRQLFDQGHLHVDTHERQLDGTPIIIEGDYICLYDSRGRITGHFGVQRDITETQIAVRTLADSEAKYRLLVENQTDLIVKVDCENRILFASPSYCELFGKTSCELLGQTFMPLVHEDDQAATQAAMAALSAPPHTCYLEQRAMTVHGWRWLAWSDRAVLDPAGNIVAIVGVGRDITERKQAELKLQKSEARFRNVAANLPGAVFRYGLRADGSETIHFLNQGCTDIWELEQHQLEDNVALLWNMVVPEDRVRVWQQVQQSAVSLHPWACEWRIVTPSGRHKWLQGMARPERLANGDVFWDTLILDISDRKTAELALTQTSQQLQSFLDNTPAIACLIDTHGRYLKANKAAADIFNLEPESLVNKAFSELLPPETAETFMGRIAHIAAHHTPLVVEDRLTLNGQEQVFQSILFPVTENKDGSMVLGSIATDITPLVHAQTALRRQAEEERLIRTMTQHIRESLDVQQILDTTVNEIRQFLHADRVLVYRFTADWSGDMIVESVIPPWSAVLGTTLKDPCFDGVLASKYIHEGYIGQIDDVAAAAIAPCHKELLAQFQVQANLTIPINCRGQLWGLLCVHQCQGPRQWRPEEVNLLRQVADQVAIALYQGQLLCQSKARASQEKLLNDIVAAISDSLELDELLQRAADEMLSIFHTSRSVIISFTTHTPHGTQGRHHRPQITVAAGPGIDDLRHHPIPVVNNPLVSKIMGQETPIDISDVARVDDLTPMLPYLETINTRAILAVAIRYRGEFKGILGLHQCHSPRQWSQDERQLIKRVADHLAIAIQQAELYQQAQAELAERKRLEAQLRYDAFHDRLTALPNRAYFLEQLLQALDRLHENCSETSRPNCSLWDATPAEPCCPYQFAVLFLDLDRFKVINDSLGHTTGDQLLQVVAQRLRDCLPEHHLAARLGGDEFVVLLTPLPQVEVAIEVARAIHNALEAPILLHQHEVFVRASIGIALSSPDYTDPSQLLRDADIAMYQAKASDREYAIFDAPMHTLAVQQMQLENDLRRAIERQEFELYFQPIIHLKSHLLQGFEALIRWRHPQRGLISPAEFIPVAENTDLITALDLWTLNQACQHMHRWHRQFSQHRGLTINVNLSGKQFVRPDLIQQIDRVMATTHLDGQYLKLEITESVLIQNAPLAIDILSQLRHRGIKVCMDDFGTGYSSLSYLHRFPIDMLKIDKSFISGLHQSNSYRGDEEIVRAIINLAHSLNLTVVAEGIETSAQLDYLRINTCHGGQGYYFSKPLPAAAIAAYLDRQQSSLQE